MKHEDFIVSMKGIQKSFGGVHALTDGELTLRKGEVLGLIGENGAGKSTLMKILSGIITPSSGEIVLNGEVKIFDSVNDARNNGISIIHQ